MQCSSCGGDCGHSKKLGCQYKGNAPTKNVPTDAALREGIKRFRACYSENDTLNDWREFYIAVAKLTHNEMNVKTITALRDVADAVCKQFSAAGIPPLIGSPNPAEDLHARAVLALGGNVHREHIASAACWCQPVAEYTDPETGVVVWAHNHIQ